MRKVYLAGPIKGLDYNGCTEWREGAKQKLKDWGMLGVSPMRAKEHLRLEGKMGEYADIISCARGLTIRDRFDVYACDIMLANLLGATQISIGTAIEYGWADSARKPIITVIEKEGNPHDHAMIRELTGFRVETLEEGLQVARAILQY